jgi:hypothetical protein
MQMFNMVMILLMSKQSESIQVNDSERTCILGNVK